MDQAVSPLKGRFPNAVFMTIQNGIGAEALVAQVRLVGGCSQRSRL